MFLDLWYFWFTSKVLKCMYVRSPELCTPIIHMFDVLLYTYLLMWLSCYIYLLFLSRLDLPIMVLSFINITVSIYFVRGGCGGCSKTLLPPCTVRLERPNAKVLLVFFKMCRNHEFKRSFLYWRISPIPLKATLVS